MPEKLEIALLYMDLVFALLLLVEIILRCTADRGNFFKNNWNKYDFIVGIVIIIGEFIGNECEKKI